MPSVHGILFILGALLTLAAALFALRWSVLRRRRVAWLVPAAFFLLTAGQFAVLLDGQTAENAGSRLSLAGAAASGFAALSIIGLKLLRHADRHAEDLAGQLREEQESRRHAEDRLKETNRVLRTSNEELEQFAYVASHDLQEPLRMIHSYTELLSRRYRGRLDASADEFIVFILDGTRRMQSLIQDLLTYARVGTQSRVIETIDCEKLLEQVLGDLRLMIRESGAIVTHDPLPSVKGYPVPLKQVFQNLISNSIKFRREKPLTIHMGAESIEDGWKFSMHDNGIGIHPRFREHIFVIFQRLNAREYPGTGIGLAICRRIIQRHGGKIWVDSEPGKGSTFYFTIPASLGISSGGNKPSSS